MFNIKTHQFNIGQDTVKLETGRIARQATAAVLTTINKTTVLTTLVIEKELSEFGLLPLMVNYTEKSYAYSKIPGNFMKREGKPSDREALISRLIDRPIRPLFPAGFFHRTQIISTLVSGDPNEDVQVVALIGASAALAIAGLPIDPIGAALVGYTPAGGFVLNPTTEVLNQSSLNMVVAGTEEGVLMVESEAKSLPENIMIDAVALGHETIAKVAKEIKTFADSVAPAPYAWTPILPAPALVEKVTAASSDSIQAAYQIQDKKQRSEKLKSLLSECKKALVEEPSHSELVPNDHFIAGAFHDLEKKIVRHQYQAEKRRIDGRQFNEVRPINIDLSPFHGPHGSAIFTRGETQSMGFVILGNQRDAQILDDIHGNRKEPLIFHYNFPPFSVGEVGMMLSPKRREIGHGNLAKRGIQAVLPNQESFPYTIRIVSEITESNGSSSMASVCSASLALMEAGVPISQAVAGIAMGLIKDADSVVVLTDILGDEDHLGDMDFKVAGTLSGINALQMDIKITSISIEIMREAIAQAKSGYLHILDIMKTAISEPKSELPDHAPKVMRFNIDPKKIKDVIGKGGATIQEIIRECSVEVDINDKGEVHIYSPSVSGAKEARERINFLTTDIEEQTNYQGLVKRIVDFGAFVALPGGKEGLLHISQVAEEHVNDLSLYFKEGQTITVRVLSIDNQTGRIRLSYKDIPQQG